MKHGWTHDEYIGFLNHLFIQEIAEKGVAYNYSTTDAMEIIE